MTAVKIALKKFSHIHYDMASLPYRFHEWFSMFSYKKNLTKFVQNLQILCNTEVLTSGVHRNFSWRIDMEWPQDDSLFEVLQGFGLICPRWLTLGCECICTLKHCRGQTALHTSGLEGSVACLKCHFVRPSQIIICFAFLPISFIQGATVVSVLKLRNERWEKKCFLALIETITGRNDSYMNVV